MKKSIQFSLILVLMYSLFTMPAVGASKTVIKELPRNETLYFVGTAQIRVRTWNPFGLADMVSWPLGAGDMGCILTYEPLFMYNMLTGVDEPLLGTKQEWIDKYTVNVHINKAAHFSDGNPVTAADVAYTYNLGNRYNIGSSSYWQFLEYVKPVSNSIVQLKLKKDNLNRLLVIDSFTDIGIMPKHIWEDIETKYDYDLNKIREYVNDEPVGSGPYKLLQYDDVRGITIIRDDAYWGKALFGKLPEPKYIHYPVHSSNDTVNRAFKKGQIDFSQTFIPNVWKMWEDGTPISTYLPEAPYYLPAMMPFAVVNVHKKGLDRAEVRKAIAMAIDYEKIGKFAMSGYSKDLVHGIALKTPGEMRYIDQDAVKPYRIQTDIEAANALLDSIGAKRGKDGIRVLPDGTRLGPYKIECPDGWSDWNAAAEIAVQSVKKIGIEVRKDFGDVMQWVNHLYTGSFDMILSINARNMTSSQPWLRARSMMYSKGVAPLGEQAFWNYGRWSNQRADELLEQIPTESDINILKTLYTELNTIYLKELPTIQLMYRPGHFYEFNESVWKGFPRVNDGTDIPPLMPTTGAGVRILYQIQSD